jgi:predicted acylesterase/phospholipase RssA
LCSSWPAEKGYPKLKVLVWAGVLVAGWWLWSVDERARVYSDPLKLANSVEHSDYAIALSGGGFRAAPFHAGVVDQLMRYGIRQVVFSGVSDGAIAGSFFAAGGEPKDLLARFKDGKFNVLREALSIFSLPRLALSIKLPLFEMQLWPTKYSRSALLADYLDRAFLDGVKLSDFVST